MTEKRARGRPVGTVKNRANPDDVMSIIQKIEKDKRNFDTNIANNLPKYYQMMEDLALGRGDFKKAGIKDRKTAIETLVKRAESYVEQVEVVNNTAPETTKDVDGVEQVETKSGDVLKINFG